MPLRLGQQATRMLATHPRSLATATYCVPDTERSEVSGPHAECLGTPWETSQDLHLGG